MGTTNVTDNWYPSFSKLLTLIPFIGNERVKEAWLHTEGGGGSCPPEILPPPIFFISYFFQKSHPKCALCSIKASSCKGDTLSQMHPPPRSAASLPLSSVPSKIEHILSPPPQKKKKILPPWAEVWPHDSKNWEDIDKRVYRSEVNRHVKRDGSSMLITLRSARHSTPPYSLTITLSAKQSYQWSEKSTCFQVHDSNSSPLCILIFIRLFWLKFSHLHHFPNFLFVSCKS